MIRIAILASGNGSNVEAILEAIRAKRLHAEPVVVVTNQPEAGVIQIAKRFSVPCHVIPHTGLSREAHEQQIIDTLSPLELDYIVLAGYMRVFTERFIYAFNLPGEFRIINIHPSLLPDFPGPHAYKDVFEAGIKTSGITVHFVDDGVDTGPIISQAYLERQDDDTLDSFIQRGLALEHQLYPKVLEDISQGRIRTEIAPDSYRVIVTRTPI
jgi:phosphoribosylglycinamide formyltransferase 1